MTAKNAVSVPQMCVFLADRPVWLLLLLLLPSAATIPVVWRRSPPKTRCFAPDMLETRVPRRQPHFIFSSSRST
jgi:hypothetical protein